MRKHGVFITFEGPEGSGKSTLIKAAARFFRSKGFPVLILREPGGTAISEAVREILLDRKNLKMTVETELFLYLAARAQIVAEVIKPALAAGKTVLCDRYADSTLAYQGYGLGLGLDALRAITRFATGGLVPDLTFYIDVPVEVGIARKQSDQVNRLDEKEIAYHRQVRAGFLEMARAEPSRWVVVNAVRSLELVQQDIRERVLKELK